MLAAGNKAALDEIVAEAEGMGAAVRGGNIRPDSENACAALVQAAVEYARAEGLKVDPRCSYADAWMRRHPEYQGLRA